jgi:hypothetical protein
MDRFAEITEFVVISNLENRALNAGINKAQQLWRNRHNNNNNNINQPINNVDGIPQVPSAPPPPPIRINRGRIFITILRAQDLQGSRLSMLTSSASSPERPYIVIECNQQRFQTTQADSKSTNQNPQWSSNNGPFGFNIYNPNSDRLTVWIQQQDLFHVMKRNGTKMLGMCEINVGQLIDQERAWLPLRKDNKPAGQVLIEIVFDPTEERPPAYNRNR